MLEAIPEFPVLRIATLADRPLYEEFYEQFPPYSDFSFNNLWIWFNQKNQLAFSRHGTNLILRLNNPFENNAQEFTILGDSFCTKTIHRVLRWQKAMGIKQQLVMIPQVTVDHIGRGIAPLSITEDMNNRDYIYDVGVAAKAEGGRYYRYRRELSHFRSHYSDPEVRELDLHDRIQELMLINRLHTWDTAYRQSNQATLEGLAIDRILRLSEELPVKCIALFIDGSLESFALYHIPPQNNFAIVNHLKCNNTLDYIFDMTFSCLVQRFHELGLRFVNLEQDLGLPGLRTHKERLRPVNYLRRFTIRP